MVKPTVEFKVEKNENRGCYYEETDRCLIYLPMHETIADVYKTITHEMLHYVFANNEDIPSMDEDQEEKIIFFTQWAEISL